MNATLTPTTLTLMLGLGLLASACSGGGGGGGGSTGPGNTALFGGIRAASTAAKGPVVQNILAVGDRYEMTTDPAARQAAADGLWRKLSRPASWVHPTDARFTFQFYEDPTFRPGPLFRYTGDSVFVGGVVVNTIGRYTAADGRGPFLAVGLHTWDHNPEFLVLASDSELAHAIEHFNGLPNEKAYRAVVR